MTVAAKKNNNSSAVFIKALCIFTLIMHIIIPACILPFKLGGGSSYSIGNLLLFGLLFFFAAVNLNSIVNAIKKLFAFNAFKILLLFFISEFILILVHTLLGSSLFLKAFISYIFRISQIILPVFFGFYLLNFFKMKAMLKIYVSVLYLSLVIGLVEFVIFFYDITLLTDLYNCINNLRIVLNNHVTRAYVNIFPRIQSGFDEPAYYAFWLNAHVPFIYNISMSKYKIFKNNFINNFIKKSFPLLLFLVILGIQSPIHLVFFSSITFIYFLIRMKISLKSLIIILVSIFITGNIAFYVLNNINLSNTFFNRIQTVLEVVTNINTLVLAEQSLGTRLISYSIMLLVFFKHPFIGCGTGNFTDAIDKMSLYSPLPYTPEYISRMASSEHVPTNSNILYGLLAEQGVFVTLIYYWCIFALIETMYKMEKFSAGIGKDVFQGFKYILTVYVFLNFYESIWSYFWLEIGLMLGFVYKYKRKYLRSFNENFSS